MNIERLWWMFWRAERANDRVAMINLGARIRNAYAERGVTAG